MAKQYRQHRFTVPDGMCDMLLIRHGESMPYVEGIAPPQKDGQSDPPLHVMGHKQAEAVGERLKDTHFDALYVTPLTRTHQTASPLAKALGMTPSVEKDLREIYLGEWDGGLFRIKMEERDPLYLKAVEEQEWGLVPGAETTAELQNIQTSMWRFSCMAGLLALRWLLQVGRAPSPLLGQKMAR